jgi:hypothetical protein
MTARRGILTVDQRDQLNRLVRDKSVDAVLALRARLVLWWDDGHSAVQMAQWASVTNKTADCGQFDMRSLMLMVYAGYRIRGSQERTTTAFVPGLLLSAGRVRQGTPVRHIGRVEKWRNI